MTRLPQLLGRPIRDPAWGLGGGNYPRRGEISLARTVAGLTGSEAIQPAHLAEAIQYRPRRQN